jgi:hypothetical protein
MALHQKNTIEHVLQINPFLNYKGMQIVSAPQRRKEIEETSANQ